MKLPASVEEIAEVIGRERALYLVGQLPCCYVQDKRRREGPNGGKSRRVILYVPKTLKPDHYLVAILGWRDAQRMVDVFGGELLCPPTLRDVVYRPFRDAAIVELHQQGVAIGMLAEWFDMTERRVRQVLEIPQEGRPQADNDNRARTIRASA